VTTDYNLRERELRARPGRFPDSGEDPNAALGRVSVSGRERRAPIAVSRPSGAGVLTPRYNADEARLKIISTSPTLVEEEVDRRMQAFYSEGGTTQMPTDPDELAFRRKQFRDQVWGDINVINNRHGASASVAQVGMGIVSGTFSTAYRPFGAVAAFFSVDEQNIGSPQSYRQAWDALTGDDPFRHQGRNVAYISKLPDNDFLPFSLSARDVAGGVVDVGIDVVLTGGLVRMFRGVSAGAKLGVPPVRTVADLPTPQQFAEDIGGSSRIARAVAGHTGIDPSTLLDTELGRLALGYKRAEIAGEGLTQVALSPLDAWARPFSGRAAFGRNGWLFKTDKFGNLENIAVKKEPFVDPFAQWVDNAVPKPEPGMARLWAGGIAEAAEQPQLQRGTFQLAMPEGRGGPLAYVDVPERDLAQYARPGARSQYELPPGVASNAREVDAEIVTRATRESASATSSQQVSRAWNDVFSNPDRYNLTPDQRKYVDQVIALVDEVDQMRVRAGLPSRAKDTSPEGWFYVPRTVSQLDDLIVNGRTDPGSIRKYEEMAEGMANGVTYESDLRAVLDAHIRNAYHEVNAHRLNQVVEQIAINPARVQRGGEFARVRAPGAKEASDQLGGVMTEFRRTIRQIEELSNTPNIDDATRTRLAAAEQRLADAEFNLQRMRAIDPDEAGIVPTKVILDEEGNVLEALPSGTDPFDDARRLIDETLVEIVDIWRRTSDGRDLNALNEAIARAEGLGAEATDLRLLAAQTERIRVGRWRNFVLPDNIAEEMNRIAPSSAEQANIFNRGFQTLGDAVRFNSAVGDFAAPFLQGLPVLFRDPATWARSTALSYYSFLDPTVMSRHIRDNIGVYQRMAQNGVPVGDNEFFAALARGRNTNVFGIMQNVVRRLPGDLGDNPHMVLGAMKNQSYGRFQATYDTFLAASRSMMWEGLETGWERRGGGSLMNLARHMRNMTGGLDTRALGVGANQRGFESTWLAFAPRYTRSVAALAAEMFDSNPAIRTEAIRAVGSTLAGVHMAFIGVGLAMGKSEEEILTSLNPLEGKKYLSYQMGDGDWVGVGGTVRSMTQTIAAAAALGAEVITDPSRLADLNLRDVFDANNNPFLRFIEGRAAPGQTILRAGIEAASGGTVDSLPFTEINGGADLTRFFGTSMLPFAVQGKLEGEDLSTASIAVAGLRTSAQTPNERKTAILDLGVRAAGMGETFEAVAAEHGEPATRQRIREFLTANDPASLAEFDRLEAQRFEDYRRDRAIRRDPVAIAVLAGVDARDKIIGLVNETPTDLEAIRTGATQALIEARAIREQDFVQAALEGLPQAGTEPQKDLDRYFEVLDIENEGLRDEAEAAFRAEIGPERYSRLLSNVFAVSQPMPQQWVRIQAGKRTLTETGFFDQSEPSWKMVRDRVAEKMDSYAESDRAVAQQILDSKGFETWYDAEVERQQQTLIEIEGMTPEAARTRAKNIVQRHPVTQAFDDAMLFHRVEWAKAHPEEANEAYALGYLQGSDTNTVIANVIPRLGEFGGGAAPVAPTATPAPTVSTDDLVSAYRAGADYAALAEQYGLSIEAVRSRLRRAANGRSPESLRETDQ